MRAAAPLVQEKIARARRVPRLRGLPVRGRRAGPGAARRRQPVLEAAAEALAAVEPFEAERIEAALRELAERLGLKPRAGIPADPRSPSPARRSRRVCSRAWSCSGATSRSGGSAARGCGVGLGRRERVERALELPPRPAAELRASAAAGGRRRGGRARLSASGCGLGFPTSKRKRPTPARGLRPVAGRKSRCKEHETRPTHSGQRPIDRSDRDQAVRPTIAAAPRRARRGGPRRGSSTSSVGVCDAPGDEPQARQAHAEERAAPLGHEHGRLVGAAGLERLDDVGGRVARVARAPRRAPRARSPRPAAGRSRPRARRPGAARYWSARELVGPSSVEPLVGLGGVALELREGPREAAPEPVERARVALPLPAADSRLTRAMISRRHRARRPSRRRAALHSPRWRGARPCSSSTTTSRCGCSAA